VGKISPGARLRKTIRSRGQVERQLQQAVDDLGGVSATVTNRDDVEAFSVLYEDIENDEQVWTMISALVLFAAALAASLACGKNLGEAFKEAKNFVFLTLSQGFAWTTPDGQSIHALNQAPRNPDCELASGEKSRRTGPVRPTGPPTQKTAG